MKQIKNFGMKKLRSQVGATILELLLAAFITGIITASAFEFYSTMHGQSEAQQQVTDSQLVSRNTVLELKKTLRMAGYKLASHDPYYVGDDTLIVYMEGSQPVDTIMYYLQEFTDADYTELPNLPTGWHVYRLMKKINSDDAVIFSDYISGMRVTLADTANAEVAITSITTHPDNGWNQNNGYRTYSVSERVLMRNI